VKFEWTGRALAENARRAERAKWDALRLRAETAEADANRLAALGPQLNAADALAEAVQILADSLGQDAWMGVVNALADLVAARDAWKADRVTAWHVTFEVDVPNGVATDDGEAIECALDLIAEGEGVITVEPFDPPSRFGPASRSQDERRP
jgi:predicted transcriptional regulator